MKWLAKIRARLRPEEIIALIFLLPFLWIAWRHQMTVRFHTTRLMSYLMPGVLVAAVVWLTHRSPRKVWQVARDFLPFVFAVWVYENMRDVTEILHLADRHEWLIRADEWLFGGINPVVWLERWISVPLTEWMIAAYTSYYLYPPLMSLVLYRRGQIRQFRDLILALILTFYIGFVGYVTVPAMDPWVTMQHRFSVDLLASPVANEALSLYSMSSLKVARDCFPSLHTAISLVVLAFAWRSWRPFFWVALPCVLALIVSTVYLRLHYVVDLVAAVPLTVFSVWAAPRINRWWSRPPP